MKGGNDSNWRFVLKIEVEGGSAVYTTTYDGEKRAEEKSFLHQMVMEKK
jgi:hypothetical protein